MPAAPTPPVPPGDDVGTDLVVARELAARLRDGSGVHPASTRDVATLFGHEAPDRATVARLVAVLHAAGVDAQPPLRADAPDAPVVLISAAGPLVPLGTAAPGTIGVGARESVARSPARTAATVGGGIVVLSLVIGFASVLAPSSPAPRGGPPATTSIDRAGLARLAGERAVAEGDWPSVGRSLAALDGDDDRRLRAAARRSIARRAEPLLEQERWRGARRELLAGDEAFGLGGRSARLLQEARRGLREQRAAIARRERAEREQEATSPETAPPTTDDEPPPAAEPADPAPDDEAGGATAEPAAPEGPGTPEAPATP